MAPVGPPVRPKWLNVVFDLNGVLCECFDKSYGRNFKKLYSVEDNVLSNRTPTIVGTKAVFARQNVGEFLREVSTVANRVIVWTSMFKRNADVVVDYLFRDSPLPYAVLGQDRCKLIPLPNGKYYHHGYRTLYMKVLSEGLFSSSNERGVINAQNTLLVDDSPRKSICNESGNAIFLDTWSHETRRDNVLMTELLPWLRRLHSNCPDGSLQQYVNEHRIGMKPLDGRHSWAVEIVNAMRISADALGVRYELPALNLVIEPPRRM